MSDVLLWIALIGVLLACGGSIAQAAQDPHDIVLENEAFRVAFDPATGSVVSLYHRKADLELIAHPDAARSRPPWELYLGESDAPIEAYSDFEATGTQGGLSLTWRLAGGIEIRAEAMLEGADGPLRLRTQVISNSPLPVASLTFPVLRGIGALRANGMNDYLAHPVVTGFKFRNPYLLFSTSVTPGVRHARYPSGEGAPMQFMAYYTEGVGGFYFGAHDPHKTMKEIDFYHVPRGTGSPVRHLVASFRHWNWDRRPGDGLPLDYDIIVAPLRRGDWYEAGDIYRDWASEQSWTRSSRLVERPDNETSRWLNESVGLSTFGAKGNQWSPEFYAGLGESIPSPIFHILYGYPIPNGGNLHRDNLDAIRQNDGRFSTFENDILVPRDAPDYLPRAAIQPYQEIRWGSWRAVWMDPTTAYIQDRQAGRAARLMRDYLPDAFYYDISTSFAPMGCLDPAHDHEAVGYGRWMVDAYMDFHRLVRESVADIRREKSGERAESEAYLPMGTEGIHELALEVLDFYQARANAYPASFDFEGREFKPWIQGGAAEKIPLFTYVYHEFGGIRLDGWGHLSEEEGDYAYAVAARTALWGGIYQLNYEFGAFDAPPGPEKLRFLSDIARARTDYGRPYLAYGRMMPSPDVQAGTVELSYRLRNLPFGNPERTGKQRVPKVIASAWESAQGGLAFFFVNVTGDELSIEWRLDPELYGLGPDASGFTWRILVGGEEIDFDAGGDERNLRLTLPARRVVMAELVAHS